MNEKITILIPSCGVNFEGALKPCIESLLFTTDLKVKNELLLMMNGMKDEKKFDTFINPLIDAGNQIDYVWSNKPLGYVGAINTGLRHIFSQKETPDYVLFLNDDVTVHTIALFEEMKAKFQEDPLLGLVGAKSLPCPITGVDFPLGWCVLIKKEVFEKIGYLDTAFGIGYGDDTDFAIKAIKAGYHVFSYVNGYDKKLKKSVGNFGAAHLGEGTMHSGEFFSLEDWDKQTAKNRGLLAQRYWERVHVIVPVYKRYAKLQKALNGLRNQWYTNLVVHVVSDGDDNGVKAIVETYKAAWGQQQFAPEIEYSFVEPPERGYGGLPRKSILDSLESAKNEWVCFVDSDNSVNPDYILKLWQATFLKPEIGMAICKINHIEQGNRVIPEPEFWEKIEWSHIDSLNAFVRLDIAKKHADKWIHDKKRTII
jgi:GT2 family glycosyltransferase